MGVEMIQIRNKEHQSLGIKELEQLCNDNPNDSSLGLAIREMVKQARISGYMKSDPYDNDEYSKSHDENEENSRAADNGIYDWRKGTIWAREVDEDL
tara:strand:+ start:720 stop:1010 length:291 start_codon:yes stop_codon:yes gene_type:complete